MLTMIKDLESQNVYTRILDGELLLNRESELPWQIDLALSFSTAVSKTLLNDSDNASAQPSLRAALSKQSRQVFS